MDSICKAAKAIQSADALIIGAGAGMGVDSGLPDFRGNQGFWENYPIAESLGLNFTMMANPELFKKEPETAWGFYGHRYNLYKNTKPHQGFKILHKWVERCRHHGFVFTSNVDGQFQQAGFDPDRIVEIHGSIMNHQCTANCTQETWPCGDNRIPVDEACMKATRTLPHCPNCSQLARPNILMFGDWEWNSARTDKQLQQLQQWLEGIDRNGLVVIELGAGTSIPTVRNFCEQAGGQLIRINPSEADVHRGISLPMGAEAALSAIDKAIKEEIAG